MREAASGESALGCGGALDSVHLPTSAIASPEPGTVVDPSAIHAHGDLDTDPARPGESMRNGEEEASRAVVGAGARGCVAAHRAGSVGSVLTVRRSVRALFGRALSLRSAARITSVRRGLEGPPELREEVRVGCELRPYVRNGQTVAGQRHALRPIVG